MAVRCRESTIFAMCFPSKVLFSYNLFIDRYTDRQINNGIKVWIPKSEQRKSFYQNLHIIIEYSELRLLLRPSFSDDNKTRLIISIHEIHARHV